MGPHLPSLHLCVAIQCVALVHRFGRPRDIKYFSGPDFKRNCDELGRCVLGSSHRPGGCGTKTCHSRQGDFGVAPAPNLSLLIVAGK